MSTAETTAPPAEPEPSPSPSPLVQRLAEARVELRKDLDVSRHVFRGEVSYVLQDPLTFQSHRFGVDDYHVLACLKVERTLAECFRSLVEHGRLEAEREEEFYHFVFQMHRYGFLKLPVSDEETLYKRHVAKRAQKRKAFASSLLFLPVPLFNPDAFLGRTMRWIRPLCSRMAFWTWLAVVATAGWVLAASWGEFQRPVADIFAGGNLPLLWLTLIGLKVVHEFGHAYACKYFGGHVPEMGVMLLLFTPCAYVDASSSWGFTRKRERLIVCMAGMYVELFCAAVALLLWSVTPPGVARECLHNVVLLASVVTVGFNINPLMRYDGYYALSDAVEVPNLRSRSQAWAKAVLKKLLFGVPIADRPRTPEMRVGLLVFGIAAAVYKVTLVLGISIAIATKFFAAGLLLAAAYFGAEIVKIVRKTVPYLWSSEELADRRVWARGLCAMLVGGIPVLVAGVPVPNRVTPPGVVMGGTESILRAEASGFLERVNVVTGERVAAGTVLVELDEPDKHANLSMSEARLRATELRHEVHVFSDLAQAAQDARRVEQLASEVEFQKDDLRRLRIVAPVGGLVVSCLDADERGRLVKRGEEVATVTRGAPVVRALLTEEDVASTRPRVGLAVEFRSYDDPTRVYSGVVRRVDPRATRELGRAFLDHLDLTEFSLHPVTREASRNQFQVEVELSPEAAPALRHGMTGRLRIRGQSETIGHVLYRKLIAFANRLKG